MSTIKKIAGVYSFTPLVMLAILPLLTFQVGCRVVDFQHNPFDDDKLQRLEVGRYQSAHNLWAYAFAIPILYRFRNGQATINSKCHQGNVREIHPLLLLPYQYEREYGNPFLGVKEEHYDRSDEPFDLQYVLDEVVSAFKENREVSYPRLAERFSLITTVMALEDCLLGFDEEIFTQEETLVAAMKKLRKDFEGYKTLVYRRPGASPATLKLNGLFLQVRSFVPGGVNVILSKDVWEVMKPYLTVYDRKELYYSIHDRKVTNDAVIAELMMEFPTQHIPRSLPVDFFQRHVTMEQIKTWSQGLPCADKLLVSLTCSDASDMKLDLDVDSLMKRFLLRRYIHLAKEPHPLVTLDSPISVIDEGRAFLKGLIPHPDFKKIYTQAMDAIAGNQPMEIPNRVLELICHEHPDIKLPTTISVYGTYSQDIFHAALQSKHGALALNAIPFHPFHFRNLCGLLTGLEPDAAKRIVEKDPNCLVEVARNHGIGGFDWQKLTCDFLVMKDFTNTLIIDKMEDALPLLKDQGAGDDRQKPSPFFLAQLGMTRIDPLSLAKIPLPWIRQIVWESKVLDRLNFAEDLRDSVTEEHVSDNHHYVKLMTLIFQDLPASMPDDRGLFIYLRGLLLKLDPTWSFGSAPDHTLQAFPAPFEQEKKYMANHLYIIFRDRILESLVSEHSIYFKEVLTAFKVTGTTLSIQFSKEEADFKTACSCYFKKAGFEAEPLRKLFIALGERSSWLMQSLEERIGEWSHSEPMKNLIFELKSHETEVATKILQSDHSN